MFCTITVLWGKMSMESIKKKKQRWRDVNWGMGNNSSEWKKVLWTKQWKPKEILWDWSGKQIIHMCLKQIEICIHIWQPILYDSVFTSDNLMTINLSKVFIIPEDLRVKASIGLTVRIEAQKITCYQKYCNATM